jgi:hypothetical protein
LIKDKYVLDMTGLNFWAVLLVWLLNIGLGAYWYSPAGFGRLWSKLSGVDMMKLPKAEANKAIAFVALGALIQAYVLALVVRASNAATLIDGVVVGLVVWAGLTAAPTIGNTLYSRLGWKFWWLNSSFFLIVMVVGAAVLAVWR